MGRVVEGNGERWAGPSTGVPGDSSQLPAGSLAVLGICQVFGVLGKISSILECVLQIPQLHHGIAGSFPEQYI